ncbi:AMP deaminase, putative [Entamoeba invadens IP1]|uniref:AMP deaminase, putative n=1 Tax=Entamoeba invadens IP1 TaxID=370355 RepID=UPI0002C3F54C|nr:AMP deaminase, putative [Entamoeba invadens IP1]ELP90521.1 AMP deaminase, putative [Entamoeba invadens IP1]|eukprot:XP_004257292.1 AMP deaminase, putative [Entamoeba invadens IP1]
MTETHPLTVTITNVEANGHTERIEIPRAGRDEDVLVSSPLPRSRSRSYSRNNSVKNKFTKILDFTNTLNQKAKDIVDDDRPMSPSLLGDAEVTIERSINWVTDERKKAASMIQTALKLRTKYQNVTCEALEDSVDIKCKNENGVLVFPPHFTDGTVNDTTKFIDDEDVRVYQQKGVFVVENVVGNVQYTPPSFDEYVKDYNTLLKIVDDGPTKTFSSERMQEIHHQFEAHKILSIGQSKSGKDFFSAIKVDTHIHADSFVTEKNLVKFIRDKFKENAVVKIKEENGKTVEETFDHFCERTGISVDKLTLNKIGNGRNKIEDTLYSIFLRYDNSTDGKYFADLLNNWFKQLIGTNTYAELRLQIFGYGLDEYVKLAKWVKKYHVKSSHNKWLIQLPRHFVSRKSNEGGFTFSKYLANFFEPLFLASTTPEKYPELTELLESVSGFDSVDDEGLVEAITWSEVFDPDNFTQSTNPSYFIYMYYLYVNITTLNLYRMSRGMSTFDFRPHSGETGHYSHLAATFLVAKSMSHGIKLVDSPSLNYLYFLTQIGLSLSPMANHLKSCSYKNNPFDNFFVEGLNVTLSTDKPLYYHRTQDALLEEYAMAQQTYKYEDADMVEMCDNSIKQSGFSVLNKLKMLQLSKGGRFSSKRTLFRERILNTEFQILDALQHENKNGLFLNLPYSTVDLNFSTNDKKEVDVMRKVTYFMSLREKYLEECPPAIMTEADEAQIELPTREQLFCSMENGVYNIYNTPDSVCDIDKFHHSFIYCFDCKKKFCKKCFKQSHKDIYHSIRKIPQFPFFPTIPIEGFLDDYTELVRFCADGPSRSYCYKQLKCREEIFLLHKILNNSLESQEMKKLPVDFEKCIKVDSVVSASRSFHPKDLLRLIEKKVSEDGDRVVFPELKITTENGMKVYKHVILKNAFQIYKVKEFSLDKMSVSCDPSMLQRYDLWDTKNTVFNVKELRDLFLTTNNFLDGEYFCEFLKQTQFNKKKITSNIKTEMHLCLYGRKMSELEDIAKIVIKEDIIREDSNKFSIQIPRKYSELKKAGDVTCFEDVLRNIFEPIFLSTLNPDKYPELTHFLNNVGAFDCKGDEMEYEGKLSIDSLPLPRKWNSHKEPPFVYWIYFVKSNLFVLNNLRRSLKMNTFDFKPHCGEAGDPMHNAAAFLTADSISHGNTLDNQNTLQYLFILARIGIVCCPIYDKFLYDIVDHPFYKYFMRGMLVTLSTDSPMHTHSTKEPLVEEYASTIKQFKLTATDIAEITQNSVTVSSFPETLKKDWMKDQNLEPSNVVPETRIAFREKYSQIDLDTLLKFNIGSTHIAQESKIDLY